MSVFKQKNKENAVVLKEYTWKYDFKHNWMIYLLFTPVLVYFLIFHYAPMFGLIMAFENFKPSKGFFGSPFLMPLLYRYQLVFSRAYAYLFRVL